MEEQEKNIQKKPAKCPFCGCTDIAISVQYRKSTIFRALKFAFIIALLLTIIFNMAEILEYYELDKTNQAQAAATLIQQASSNEPSGVVKSSYIAAPLIIVFIIGLVACELALLFEERKTRVYFICKDCYHHWYENDFFE